MPATQLSLSALDPAPVLPEGFILKTGAVDPAGQVRLVEALWGVLQAAPPVHTRVKGGGQTSAAMTNCGPLGWWSDAKGYRYEPANPADGLPWPPIPDVFIYVVQQVTAKSPWPGFSPDACLINYYGEGAKMGLHQDKDEADFAQPIITVCLGDSADFMVGGFQRADKPVIFKVASGDVLLMGGASRMRFHGVRKVHAGTSPIPGLGGRYSLTFRKAS